MHIRQRSISRYSTLRFLLFHRYVLFALGAEQISEIHHAKRNKK